MFVNEWKTAIRGLGTLDSPRLRAAPPSPDPIGVLKLKSGLFD
jgi:hypothetical protein